MSLPPLVVVSICSVRLLKPADRLDQMGERPSQAVEPPDHERVATAGERDGLLKARSIRRGTTRGVREGPLAAGRDKGVLLE